MPPLSLRRPQQFYDRVPDRRRQAMPLCDEFPECRAVPTPFRQPLGAVFTNAIRKTICVKWDAGAIPAALGYYRDLASEQFMPDVSFSWFDDFWRL